MAIENRNLEVGARLVATYKKADYVCLVEAGEEGKLQYRVEGIDKVFSSPSSAASTIIKGAANGWRFWSVEGAASTATTAARAPTKAARASKAPKAGSKPRTPKGTVKIIRPDKHQEDLDEGQVRYWCDACVHTFVGFAGAEPEQCPNGHRNDDPAITAPVAVEAAQ